MKVRGSDSQTILRSQLAKVAPAATQTTAATRSSEEKAAEAEQPSATPVQADTAARARAGGLGGAVMRAAVEAKLGGGDAPSIGDQGPRVNQGPGDAPATNDGIAGGHQRGSDRIQTGGSTKASETKGGEERTITSDDVLARHGRGGDAEGKKVGIDDFSRDQQLRELADPNAGVDQTGGGNARTRSLLEGKDGVGLVADSQQTPHAADGKNQVSEQDQQGGDRDYKGSTTRHADGSVTRTMEHGGRLQITHTNADGTHWRKEGDVKTGASTTTHYDKDGKTTVIAHDDGTGPGGVNFSTPSGAELTIDRKTDPKKQPMPDDAGGDGGPMPWGLDTADRQKSPGERQVERERQVTLPNDEQGRQPDRMVTVDGDAAQMTLKRRADPYSQPVETDGTVGSQEGGGMPKHGPDADGGPKRPGGKQGGGAPGGGPTPDNPVQTTGATGATAAGGSAGDEP